MTRAQLDEAIEQMKIQCRLKMADYEAVSARSLLLELGYEADVDEVLAHIAAGGFTYCLDSSVMGPNGDPHKPGSLYPSQSVCYWGPDQLESRLDCLHFYAAAPDEVVVDLLDPAS